MKPLDVDALLKKNPAVDKDEISRVIKEGKLTKPAQPYGSASPYRGRRLFVDDRAKLDEQSTSYSRHYRTI